MDTILINMARQVGNPTKHEVDAYMNAITKLSNSYVTRLAKKEALGVPELNYWRTTSVLLTSYINIIKEYFGNCIYDKHGRFNPHHNFFNLKDIRKLMAKINKILESNWWLDLNTDEPITTSAPIVTTTETPTTTSAPTTTIEPTYTTTIEPSVTTTEEPINISEYKPIYSDLTYLNPGFSVSAIVPNDLIVDRVTVQRQVNNNWSDWFDLNGIGGYVNAYATDEASINNLLGILVPEVQTRVVMYLNGEMSQPSDNIITMYGLGIVKPNISFASENGTSATFTINWPNWLPTTSRGGISLSWLVGDKTGTSIITTNSNSFTINDLSESTFYGLSAKLYSAESAAYISNYASTTVSFNTTQIDISTYRPVINTINPYGLTDAVITIKNDYNITFNYVEAYQYVNGQWEYIQGLGFSGSIHPYSNINFTLHKSSILTTDEAYVLLAFRFKRGDYYTNYSIAYNFPYLIYNIPISQLTYSSTSDSITATYLGPYSLSGLPVTIKLDLMLGNTVVETKYINEDNHSVVFENLTASTQYGIRRIAYVNESDLARYSTGQAGASYSTKSEVTTTAAPTTTTTLAPTTTTTQAPTTTTVAPDPEAGKLYVRPAPYGNDTTGNGSYSAPYATIARAASVAVSGDTIVLFDGRSNTHAITSSVSIRPNVSITSYTGELPAYIDCSTCSGYALILESDPKVTNSQTFKALVFEGDNSCNTCIYLRGRDNVQFNNCQFYNFNQMGILARGISWQNTTNNLTLLNCKFENCSGEQWGNQTGALTVTTTSNLLINNCSFRETKATQGWPIKMWYDGGIGGEDGGFVFGVKILNSTVLKSMTNVWGGNNMGIAIESKYVFGMEIANCTVCGGIDPNNCFSWDGRYVQEANKFEYGAWIHDNIIGFADSGQPDAYNTPGWTMPNEMFGIILEMGCRDIIVERNTFRNTGILSGFLRPSDGWGGETASNITFRYNKGYNLHGGVYDAPPLHFQMSDSNPAGIPMSNTRIYNNTFSGNKAHRPTEIINMNRDGVCTLMEDIHIYNNILMNSSGAAISMGRGIQQTRNLYVRNNIMYNVGSTVSSSYSIADSSNNRVANPYLVDEPYLYLTPASTVAIDTGLPVPSGVKDLLGNTIPLGLGPNIGCYEVINGSITTIAPPTTIAPTTTQAPTTVVPTTTTTEAPIITTTTTVVPTTTQAPTTLEPTLEPTTLPGAIYENLLTNSEDFTANTWDIQNTGVTLNQGIDMSGRQTLARCDVRNYNNKISQTISVTPGQVYYLSYDVILGTSNNVQYSIYNPTTYSNIQVGNLVANASNSVTRQQLSFTIPTGCTSIALELCVYNDFHEVFSTSGNVYLGRVQLATDSSYLYIRTTDTPVIAIPGEPTQSVSTTTEEPILTTTQSPSTPTLGPVETLNDKLVFLHHSTGGQLLADNYGGLGRALNNAGYFVSDACYEWDAPQNNNIGDYMDIGNWYTWFADETVQGNGQRRRDNIMNAAYSENRRDSYNSSNFGTYTRNIAEPQGENSIIMFKSCWSSGDIANTGSASIFGLDHNMATYTVANCQAVYNAILPYFMAHTDKMFIMFTTPPRPLEEGHTSATYANNLRTLNNWLMTEWLQAANWVNKNVYVFDYHNILTGVNNHHRAVNGVIERVIPAGSGNYLISAYHSSGDEHPNPTAQQKAANELMSLIPVWKSLYYSQGGSISTTATPVVTTTNAPVITTIAPTTTTTTTEEPITTSAPQGIVENLLLSSEDLGSTNWNVQNIPVTPNVANDLSNRLTMDQCSCLTYNSKISQNVNVTAGQTYILSWDGILGTSSDARYMIHNNQAYSVITSGNLAENLSSTVSRHSVSFVIPNGCTSIEVELCVTSEYYGITSQAGTISLGRLQLATNANYGYVTTTNSAIYAQPGEITTTTTTTLEPTTTTTTEEPVVHYGFELGTLSTSSGNASSSNSRIRTSFIPITGTGLIEFDCVIPVGCEPQVAWGYNGTTPVVRITPYTLEDNVISFTANGTYNTVRLVLRKEDQSDFTQSEAANSYVTFKGESSTSAPTTTTTTSAPTSAPSGDPQNLLLYSEDFTGSAWAIDNASLNDDGTTRPLALAGGSSLNEIGIPSWQGGFINVSQDVTVTPGGVYYLSFDISRDAIAAGFTAFGIEAYDNVNWSTGTVTDLTTNASSSGGYDDELQYINDISETVIRKQYRIQLAANSSTTLRVNVARGATGQTTSKGHLYIGRVQLSTDPDAAYVTTTTAQVL